MRKFQKLYAVSRCKMQMVEKVSVGGQVIEGHWYIKLRRRLMDEEINKMGALTSPSKGNSHF